EERERRIQSDDEGDGDQYEEPAAVEKLPEKERAHPTGSHRERVEDRNPRTRHHMGAAEVKGDERVVGEPESHEAGTEAVPPEGRRIVSTTLSDLAPVLDATCVGETNPGARHQQQGHDRRNGECGEAK